MPGTPPRMLRGVLIHKRLLGSSPHCARKYYRLSLPAAITYSMYMGLSAPLRSTLTCFSLLDYAVHRRLIARRPFELGLLPRKPVTVRRVHPSFDVRTAIISAGCSIGLSSMESRYRSYRHPAYTPSSVSLSGFLPAIVTSF